MRAQRAGRAVVVGVFAAALMPYEIHFYSSGAIEEGWDESSLRENRLNAFVGYALGGVLAGALVIASGYLFHPLGVDPTDLGTAALPAQSAFGETGLLLALGGCCSASAAPPSTPASPPPTTWPVPRLGVGPLPRTAESAALHGLLAGLPLRRDADRAERDQPGRDHRVLGRLLGRRLAAHLSADPDDRRRPLLHGQHANGRIAATFGKAEELGLGNGDDPENWLVKAAMELNSEPGAFSELIGTAVTDQAGHELGRVLEVRAHWERDGSIVLDELLVGRRALWQRLRGRSRTSAASPGRRSRRSAPSGSWCAAEVEPCRSPTPGEPSSTAAPPTRTRSGLPRRRRHRAHPQTRHRRLSHPPGPDRSTSG